MPGYGRGLGFGGHTRRTGVGEFHFYVNPLIGDDGNPGTFALPFATIDAVPLANNKRIGLVRGQIYREQINFGAFSGITVAPYGLGDDPKLFGSNAHTSGWSNVSGDVWEKDIGYTAVNAFVRDGSTVTKLILGTYGALSAGQFGVSSNVLQVRVGASIDPNAITIEVPVNGTLVTATAIYSTTDSNVTRDLALWFWGQNGVEVAGGDGFQAIGLDIAFNSNDGAGAHDTVSAATNVLFGECTIRRNGKVRGAVGSEGDGISFHDNSTGAIRGCTFTDNEKEAIGNQPGTTVVVEFNYMRNNWQEMVILGNGAAGKGEQDIRNNVAVWTSTNQTSSFGAFHIVASTNRPNVRIYNNTIYAEATSSGLSGLRVAGGDVVARNNIIKGFNRGIDHRSTDEANASLDNDYNCMHGNTTQYYNNGTPGVVAGANDITTDPLFTNAAIGDFTLQSGSPCRGAGVDVGLTRDLVGTPVPNPPDIGAYQYAA